MKILLMTDMEGSCGILDFKNWCVPHGRYYKQGMALLTEEANAAAEGFFEAGASEVVVVDGHGFGGIDPTVLDSRVRYSRNWDGPYPFGLDRSFHAVAYVGQHAKSGATRAHLAHTGSFRVKDFRINEYSVGEFGQMTFIASAMGVPVIFGSGDKAFTLEARRLVRGIEVVSVKVGTQRQTGALCSEDEYMVLNSEAVHINPEDAREKIRMGATTALRRYQAAPNSFSMPRMRGPFSYSVSYRKGVDDEAFYVESEGFDDIVEALNSHAERRPFQKLHDIDQRG